MVLISRLDNSKWVMGRVGMEYRDLVPGGLGGKMVASHIRLNAVGAVPDYVHYHKVRFQMIYCWRGRVKVVYEDCGEPFWLDPGDCVLQPPEIRHRVLEAEAGAEVVEVTSPAVHETWADHDLDLPNTRVNPHREFSGQCFVRHIAAAAEWKEDKITGCQSRDTGILAATGGLADVRVLRPAAGGSFLANNAEKREAAIYFLLKGGVKLEADSGERQELAASDAFVVRSGVPCILTAAENSEILRVIV